MEEKSPNEKIDLQNEIDGQISKIDNIQKEDIPNSSFIPKRPEPEIESVPAETPISKEQTPADDFHIPSIRTFKADINSTVQTDKISTAKILLAEQKKREKEEEIVNKKSIKNPKNQFKLIFSLILIGAAVAGIVFATIIFLNPEEKRLNDFVLEKDSDLITIDQKIAVDATGMNELEIKNEINSFFDKVFEPNSLREIIFFEVYNSNEEVTSKKISIPKLLSVLNFNLQENLIRSFTGDYILGQYEKHPFWLFKLDNFDSAYDAMFVYENYLAEDFSEIFGGFEGFLQLEQLLQENVEQLKLLEEQAQEDGSNAQSDNSDEKIKEETTKKDQNDSTTPEQTEEGESIEDEKEDIQTQIINLRSKVESYRDFTDVVLENIDARAVFSEDKKILIFYVFIDREWLLIADDVKVLKEVKRRIRENNLVR